MGIPGLMTYISNRSEQFLRYYELHNTYLVIDGNSIACQIYNWHARCNCAFGGDYDKYARIVAVFFDNLLKCNVTPLVLLDGGYEDKKLKTVISRARQKICSASLYTPLSQSRLKFFPLFIKEVFKEVLNEKGIKYAQCTFEADNAIAAVARTFNCPVLSYDSDFYIYGVLYIPFDTVEQIVFRNRSSGDYFLKCRIYDAETLVRKFRGLNKSMLPLAAILLGNDYVKRYTFSNFFRHMKLPKTGKRRYNEQQRRIEGTLSWLSRYTLNNAIVGILSRLPKIERRKVLDIIENVMDGYTKLSASVMIPLGFSQEYIVQLNARFTNESFKFVGDINNLTYIEETSQGDDLVVSEEEEEDDEIAYPDSQFCSNEKFIDVVPAWFIDEFNAGQLPTYFIDLLTRGLYVCPVQIEDYFFPSTIVTCLKIISVISGLLRLSIDEQYDYIEYMTRGENGKLMRFQLKRCNSVFSCTLPLLRNLREIPSIIRKGILDHTLNVTNEFMHGIPPEWMLYFATINYWLQQNEEPSKLSCHVYSLLLTLLFPIIDQKIGLYRNTNSFHLKFDHIIQAIKHRRGGFKYDAEHSTNLTISDACKNIDRDDCVLAAPFFISHFENDQKVFTISKKFNVTIVHMFNEFQNCLRHSMNLNALLGYPYVQTKISNMYNGTLLYNLCSNFKKRNDAEVYINSVLQQSPTLLQLFRVIFMKLKMFFTTNRTTDNKVNNYKKQKIKPKADRSKEEHHVEETEISVPFYDVNNPYTLLDTME